MSETDTLLAAQAGQDTEAITTLYEQYAERVFTYCQYRCGDAATAQDLTAQVFERLLDSLHRYDAGRVPFSVWIFSIARHVVTDWQRKQYVRRLLPWDDFARRSSGAPGPEQAVVASEERRQLYRALEQLSGRERDLIGLRFSGSLTNRKIAELTGLSESSVAVILYRALRKLRRTMTAAEHFPCPAAQTEVDHERE